MRKIVRNRKIPRIILPFILITQMLVGCDKVPMNGDLDGQWQLMEIQTPEGTRDVRDSRTYLSIQLHLCQWNHINMAYYSYFVHKGDSIRFYNFVHSSLHRTKEDDNERVTAKEMSEGLMDAWGIHSCDARYRIMQLNADKLELESADTLLFFRKF